MGGSANLFASPGALEHRLGELQVRKLLMRLMVGGGLVEINKCRRFLCLNCVRTVEERDSKYH